jgi:hypothetical protein
MLSYANTDPALHAKAASALLWDVQTSLERSQQAGLSRDAVGYATLLEQFESAMRATWNPAGLVFRARIRHALRRQFGPINWRA